MYQSERGLRDDLILPCYLTDGEENPQVAEVTLPRSSRSYWWKLNVNYDLPLPLRISALFCLLLLSSLSHREDWTQLAIQLSNPKESSFCVLQSCTFLPPATQQLHEFCFSCQDGLAYSFFFFLHQNLHIAFKPFKTLTLYVALKTVELLMLGRGTFAKECSFSCFNLIPLFIKYVFPSIKYNQTVYDRI